MVFKCTYESTFQTVFMKCLLSSKQTLLEWHIKGSRFEILPGMALIMTMKVPLAEFIYTIYRMLMKSECKMINKNER